MKCSCFCFWKKPRDPLLFYKQLLESAKTDTFAETVINLIIGDQSEAFKAELTGFQVNQKFGLIQEEYGFVQAAFIDSLDEAVMQCIFETYIGLDKGKDEKKHALFLEKGSELIVSFGEEDDHSRKELLKFYNSYKEGNTEFSELETLVHSKAAEVAALIGRNHIHCVDAAMRSVEPRRTDVHP